MKRRVVLTAAVLVGLLISVGLRFVVSDQHNSSDQAAGARLSHQHNSLGQTANPRPNILFILTDDMKASDLKYMPKTQSLLEKQGVKFENAFVTCSLCCPSRGDHPPGPVCSQPSRMDQCVSFGRLLEVPR